MAPRLRTEHPAQDPDLVLTSVCAGRVKNGKWTREQRDWPIRTPLAKLHAKYTVGTSAIFGHYVFRYRHREPNRITSIDVEAADRLMSANIGAQRRRRELVLAAGESQPFVDALDQIPLAATIEDAQYDDNVCAAISVLRQHRGIKLAIATKLLCIKRPAVVPMMDRLVQDCFDTKDPATILRGFRRLLADEAIAVRVRELAVSIESMTGFAPTPVRILDELIWFDWNLEGDTKGILSVVGFEEWGYDTADDESGVHRLIGPQS